MPADGDTHVANSYSNSDAHSSGTSKRPSRARLYVLPAFIVLAITGGSLLLIWALHREPTPRELARGLQQPGRRGWQNAYALSQRLLDPEHDRLKDNQELCHALAGTLVELNRTAQRTAESEEPADEELTEFRAFLCHTLGHFRLLHGLPVLVECARAESPKGSASRERVRRAAIEAIALLASNVDPERMRTESETIDLLVAATREHDGRVSNAADTDIPSAATFALGVIGGPQATARLIELLDDIRPDVRYNAATGLARHGHPAAVSVLIQMLDPTSRAACGGERNESARARKRIVVQSNAITAAARLVPLVPEDEGEKLTAALEQLRDSETVQPRIRIAAKETLLRFDRPTD